MVEASIYSIEHSIKLVEQDRQDASIAPEDTNERLSRLHADLALYKALVQILHNNPYDPIERDPTQPKY